MIRKTLKVILSLVAKAGISSYMTTHPVVGSEGVDDGRSRINGDLHQRATFMGGPHRAGRVHHDHQVFRLR